MSTKELYIHGGAFGLPSIDPHCLALIAYLNIVSYEDYSIIECNDAALSPTGELPMLHDGKNWIAGTNRIIAYLSRAGYNADEKLSRELKAKSVSCQALTDENLADSLLFSWFADDKNYIGTVRKAYSALLPFPVRYFAPIELKKRAVRRVKKYGGTIGSDGSLTHVEHTKIYDAARDCYRVLDRRLGEKEFFFSDSLVAATTLDAKVFGYLALQLYPEIPNPRFQMILTTQFPRLVAYCDRCRDQFLKSVPLPTPLALPSAVSLLPSFSNPLSSLSLSSLWPPGVWIRETFLKTPPSVDGQGQGQGQEKDKEDEKSKGPVKSAEQRDFERKRIFAVGLGVLAMVAYVVANGLVVIGGNDEEEEGLEVYVEEEPLTLAEVTGLPENLEFNNNDD
ncbi:outer mitochondrial membrane transport complex protein-domain-containing protein [Dissophora ornata]|nr:metaxin 1 [Dissophora ornata]KAI8604285.1 outer mitochondrial membrane transport complex protein-domain-containing protein [Dissophora ornata]